MSAARAYKYEVFWTLATNLPALDAPKRVGGRVKPGHDAKLLADVSDALEFSLPTANAISANDIVRIAIIRRSGAVPRPRHSGGARVASRGDRLWWDQQPVQMLLSILLSSRRIARSSGVGPDACGTPGWGTVAPVDVR
jgi:hypothetical protein